MSRDSKMQIVVIGGDAAGMSFASKVKREKPDWNVVVFERGEHVSYAACGIPYFVSREVHSLKDLQVITADQFREKRGVDVRMGWEAIEIDRDTKIVIARDVSTGEEVRQGYDNLMIGTGANAVKPPVDGIDLEGVFTVRNLSDAKRIHEFIDEHTPQAGVIIGGGYIGLEMAEALTQREIDLHLIEMLPQVLNPMDEPITEKVMKELDRHNVDVRLDSKVSAIHGKNGKVTSISIEGAPEPIPAGIVILGSGVRPNTQLAEQAGLTIGEFGGIRVDAHQRTNDPDIYAGGDCVEQHHIVTGKPTYIPLGPAANKHGRVAAVNVLGGEAEFPGVVGTAVMKVFGLTVSRTGLTTYQAKKGGFDFIEQTIQSRERAGYYPGGRKLTLHLVGEKKTGKLLGAQIAGGETAAKRIDPYAVALHNHMKLPDIAMLDLSYAPPYSPVLDPVGVAAQVAANKLT